MPNWIRAVAVLNLFLVGPAYLSAQARPDFSGVWRLIPVESQMIGGGGSPDNEYQLTWLVNHREPEIAVGINVRNAQGSTEFSFRCTTGGEACVNELASLGEVRRMTAVWDGDALIMSQRATTPHGDFDAMDRLFLTPAGQHLVFERVVTNQQVARSVRTVFRKLGPHPSQRPAPEPLPSIALPAELERVLREYEQHWREGNAEALVALFTEDGFVAWRGN
jgi:hypothetical protein